MVTPPGQSFDRAMEIEEPAAGGKSAVPSKRDKQEYAAAAQAYLLREEGTLLKTYLDRKGQKPVADNVRKALLTKRPQIAEGIKASHAALAGRVEAGDGNVLNGVVAEAIRALLQRVEKEGYVPAADAQATASHSDQHDHARKPAGSAASTDADGSSSADAAAGAKGSEGDANADAQATASHSDQHDHARKPAGSAA